jgi:hypothetical protein
MLNLRKFARQARLDEVGEKGQRAIVEARFSVDAADLSHEVARLYLERAGALVIEGASLDPSAPPIEIHTELGLVQGAEEVGKGALAALIELRAVLGLGERTARLRDT